MIWRLAVFVAALAWAQAAAAAPAPCRFEGTAMGLVKAVDDGDTLVLDGGRVVRLTGMQAPKMRPEDPAFRAWPHAGEARDALERLTAGRMVRLHVNGAGEDRHGRLLAQVTVRANGQEIWLQQALVRAGAARVYSFADNRGCVRELLAAEDEARKAGRGLWVLDAYRIRTADDAAAVIGQYHLVEGQIRSAARVRDRLYWNFGDDYRADFTVTIPAPALRLFDGTGFDPVAATGLRVRVRGWIELRNGPDIEVSHPEQIERLD